MSTLPTAALIAALRRAALLPAPRLAELEQQFVGAGTGPEDLVRELVRRGWLTPYQAEELAAGRAEGLRLGSYRLLARVGVGGMGEVFKAHDEKLDRLVAIKRIRAEHLDNEQAVLRFRREVEAAARLEHPNIVRALDAVEVAGRYLLVMEYVEGADLGRLVKAKGPLSPGRAADCVRQAALGLAHAHAKGLVHRDVKPTNLLINAQGQVKILDLGVVLRAGRAAGDSAVPLTRMGLMVGTVDYMAPEQALDASTVDARADLYGLGCTFYFLLTGRVPFPEPEPLAKLLQHRFDEPEPVEKLRPGTPPALAALVRRLMAKKPEDRPASASAVAALLAPFQPAPPARGLPVADGPAAPDFAGLQPTPPLAGASRRRPTGRRLVFLLPWAALCVSFLAVFLLLQRYARPRQTSGEPDRGFPPVNLLARVRLPGAAVHGAWRLQNGALVSPQAACARLELPYVPPDAYELTVVARYLRGKDALVVGLPVGRHGVLVVLHGGGAARLNGLDLVDGKHLADHPLHTAGTVFRDNFPTRLRVAVGPGRIEMTANGRPVVSWRGPFDRLSLDPKWKVRRAGVLFLGSQETSYEITRVVVRPLSGPGEVLD